MVSLSNFCFDVLVCHLGGNKFVLEVGIATQLLRQVNLLLQHNDVLHFSTLLALNVLNYSFVQSVPDTNMQQTPIINNTIPVVKIVYKLPIHLLGNVNISNGSDRNKAGDSQCDFGRQRHSIIPREMYLNVFNL